MKNTTNQPKGSMDQNNKLERKNYTIFHNDFDFKIPKKDLENGFLGDRYSCFNDVIEYSCIDKDILPGIYKNGVWESTNYSEQDSFNLNVSCYDDNLYQISILDLNWDKNKYPTDTYPVEMFHFLYDIEEKWGIKFPITSIHNNSDFKQNGIVIDKKQLFEFFNDMKLDTNDLFKGGEYVEPKQSEEINKTGENEYEILDILPTKFDDSGTFSPKKFSLLEEARNGDVYITGLSQTLEGKVLSKSNLNKFVDNIQLIIMPDDYVQIKFIYKDTVGLGLDNLDVPRDVIIPKEKLDSFLQDFEIKEKVIFPKKMDSKDCEGYKKRLLDGLNNAQ